MRTTLILAALAVGDALSIVGALDTLERVAFQADREREGLLRRVRQQAVGGDALARLQPDSYALPAGSAVAITGANDGIGKAAAVFLAKQGYATILCARSQAKADEAVQHVQSQASGALVTPSHLAAQTTAALCAIQQHVDLVGLVVAFDFIAGDRTGRVSASQLTRALRRMGLLADGEPDARLLSQLIIRSINHRQGSTRGTLSFDTFCRLFEHRTADQASSPPQPQTILTARSSIAADDDGMSSPGPGPGPEPEREPALSTPQQQPDSCRSPPATASSDLRQHQRYLEYLLRCQQQGVEPAPEVTAMAHESPMSVDTMEARELAESVCRAELQLGIGGGASGQLDRSPVDLLSDLEA